jgi:cytochrome P450
VDKKQREPGDDLISRLVVEQMQTGQINRATVVLSGITMLVAGHETTANMISLGTVALLEHPDIFKRLGETTDAAEIAQIVEEMMRYLSIVHCQVDRIATEDFELGGQPIRAGDHLLMNIPAGNWDAEFAENPEVFDISRNTRGHVGFGYGAHNCIGANLARVEMQVAFATLARRLPNLRLAVAPSELKFKGNSDIYGMVELPVAW